MALFEIENLTFTYPEAERPALKDVSLTIEQGEFILICGKSGCGKTTFLRHLKTVLSPYGTKSGRILFGGVPLEEVSVREQTEKIGYVLQSPDNQIVTDKVWHELAFGMENLGYEQEMIRLRVAEMASYFGIQNWFHQRVDELSGGQKQILNLASVMAMQPKVLVLDEPTSQLDPIAAGEFFATIRKINQELGVTVIMIEHRLEEVLPMADKVLVLDEAKTLFYDRPLKLGEALKDHDLFYSMPSAVRIYHGVGESGDSPLTVKDARAWMEDYIKAPCVYEKKSAPPRDHEKVIEVKEAWFRYDREGEDIVKDLSFDVRKGELFCILGGNGTGKSTTLSLIAGLKTPYRGKIFLNGKNTKKIKDKEKFKGLLGVLPQNPQTLFVADTVEGDLKEILKERRNISEKEKSEKIKQVAEETKITHLLSMHPYDLSGGEQQRAALAKVLLSDPSILILDEPTKGLDGYYKYELSGIFKKLKNRGVTILMVSHDVEFCASYADTCGMFFDGQMITVSDTKSFFIGNSFYTTAANRIARNRFENAVTVKDVIEACKNHRQQD